MNSSLIGLPAFARPKVIRNARLLCCVSGCPELRLGFHNYCRRHRPRARKYGHHLAGPIPPKAYRQEVDHVRQLLAEHSSHAGLVAALRGLQAWFDQARAAEARSTKAQPYPSAPEVAYWARNGIPPLEVLVIVCAFTYWLKKNPGALPDDKSRDFALSRALTKLVARPIKVGQRDQRNRIPVKYAVLQHLGRFLRQWLSSFLVVVHTAMDQREQHQRDLQAALRAPMGAPVAALMNELRPQ